MTRTARIASRICTIFILFAFEVLPANASNNVVLAGMEFFNWQEFDSGGQRLLSEHGLRYLLSVENEGFVPRMTNVSYQLYWRGYTGDVDYDGQTQPPDNVFVSTTTRYTGWGLEAALRYHLRQSHSLQPALAASIGLDSWSRHLQNSTDALDNPVSGATEDYEIVYGRLGIQLKRPGLAWFSTLNIGIKYPLRTDEQVKDLNLSLEPDKRSTLYISYRLASNNSMTSRRFINLAYEAYRFGASPVVKGWQQPESHQNAFSLMVGTSF